MNYPLYIPEVVGVNGETILTISDLISLQAARAFNTEGAATLVLPSYYDPDLFTMHTRFKLWRYDYKGVPRMFGDTIWFLKKIDRSLSEHIVNLSLVDAFSMLKTRVVAYTSQTTYADKTLEELELVTYNDTLRLDNMMLAYMRENFGDEALDTDRINPSIIIGQERSVGPYGEKQASWQELDSVLSDLARQASANGANLFYDLIPGENGTFEFRIWDRFRGIDMGSLSPNPLVLSDNSGLLGEIHEIIDWTNVATVCYALGFDDGPSQVIEEVALPSLVRNDPFGRIEMTTNASDSDIPSVLIATAQEALNGRKARRSVTARVLENQSLVYGNQLSYGDQLAVEIAGRKYDVVINAVSVSWDAKGENLDIRLSGEEAVPNVTTPFVPTPGIPVPGEINTAPVADAGDNQEVEFGEIVMLSGSGTDDGLPNPPNLLTYEWTKKSGPGTATFGDITDPTTTVEFDTPGTYVLELAVSDSILSDTDEITISVDVTSPDFGLVEGVGEVAVIALDGNLYRTTDFQTASGGGGPTWTTHDLGISETIFTWVVDPFSPGYIEGVGTIDGWIVTENAIYRLSDMFGTVATSAVFTFDEPVSAASYHWRTIQASFGAFFPPGENPWLLCVSYYGNTSGHEGTWSTFSIDGGVTWAEEVQLSAEYGTGESSFSPIGVYTSPKTPGYALTVARGPDMTTGLPTWVLFDGAGVLTNEGVSRDFTFNLQAVDSVSGGGSVSANANLMIAPPTNTARIKLHGNWQSTTVRPAFSSTAAGADVESTPASVDITINTLAFSQGPGSGAGTTESGSFVVEATLDSPFSSFAWPGTDIQIGTGAGDAHGDYGLGFDIDLVAAAIGGAPCSVSVEFNFVIDEIELEDGTLYTFGPGQAQCKESGDWGETWDNSLFLDSGAAMAGTIHLPWPDNDDEAIGYHGYFDSVGNTRNFRLKRVETGVETDISPNDGSRSYGVNRGHFAARTYDSNRQYVLASVVGNDASDSTGDDFHAVYISSDYGATWDEVVAPLANSDAPDGRPAFEAAFAGDTEQVLFIWGAKGYMGYSSDFGGSVDDRSGNLPADIAIVGIAGGPTG